MRWRRGLGSCVGAALWIGGILAAANLPAGASQQVVIGDENLDDQIAIAIVDGILTLRTGDAETGRVCEIDLENLGQRIDEVVATALARAGDALAEWDDLQRDIRADRDHEIVLDMGDDVVAIDLHEVMAEVDTALREAFAAVEEGWDAADCDVMIDGVDVNEEVRAAMDELRAELRELRHELRELRGGVRD